MCVCVCVCVRACIVRHPILIKNLNVKYIYIYIINIVYTVHTYIMYTKTFILDVIHRYPAHLANFELKTDRKSEKFWFEFQVFSQIN